MSAGFHRWRFVAGLVLAVAVALAACSSSDEVPIVGQAPATPLVAGDDPQDSQDTELASSDAAAVSPTTTVTTTTTTTTTTTLPPTGVEAAEILGRGINFGNSLEAPREGDWGARLEADFFRIVADAGFEHVRLPVSWADYAGTEPPYIIPDGVDPNITDQSYSNIWERVDWAIEQAEQNDLSIIVNMHHYDEAHLDPAAHRDRLIAMWEQIAPRYADAGSHVMFELFNEPQDVFTDQPELWNDLLAELLAVVRETNPTRPVLIGPVGFNHVDQLDNMVLPDDDYLIATVHLYEPHTFTHQGAEWVDPIPPLGVPWTPDGIGLAEGIYDRSWDTRVITENDELRLDFARQWAGFSVDYRDAVDFEQVQFRVSGDGSLRVGCRVPGGDSLDEARVTTTDTPQEFTVDLTSCPDESTGVSIMNSHPNSDPLRISNFVVCSEVEGCEDVTTSADASLRQWLRQAADWRERTGVPVHLGEFGVFSAEGRVPMTDRVAWTQTVVDEAEQLGIPFSYWEFHAGYAAYDLDEQRWNEGLRDALIHPLG